MQQNYLPLGPNAGTKGICPKLLKVGFSLQYYLNNKKQYIIQKSVVSNILFICFGSNKGV